MHACSIHEQHWCAAVLDNSQSFRQPLNDLLLQLRRVPRSPAANKTHIRWGFENQAQQLVAQDGVIVGHNDLRQERLHSGAIAHHSNVGHIGAQLILRGPLEVAALSMLHGPDDKDSAFPVDV